jgi:membrane-associated phospholipid phosphatase
MAGEAGESRIYAGIHYRFDVDAGSEIGRQVAAAAAARHRDMLARWAPARLTSYTD